MRCLVFSIFVSSRKWSPWKRLLTNATIRINPHGYSYRPFRLFASPISTIRVNPHDYSPWQTTHKKKPSMLHAQRAKEFF